MIATQVVCRARVLPINHRSAAALTHTPTSQQIISDSEVRPYCETHGSMKTLMQEYNVRKTDLWEKVLCVINVFSLLTCSQKKKGYSINVSIASPFLLSPKHHVTVIKTTWTHTLNICNAMYILHD